MGRTCYWFLEKGQRSRLGGLFSKSSDSVGWREKEAFMSWVACLACIEVQEEDDRLLPQSIREIIV